MTRIESELGPDLAQHHSHPGETGVDKEAEAPGRGTREKNAEQARAKAAPVTLGSRFRAFRLEDGEVVVALGRRERRGIPGWPSDRPHAGVWSDSDSYALTGVGSRPGRRARVIRDFDARLRVTATDAEILVRGPHDAIGRLIVEGPGFCRARRRQTPRDASRLTCHRFKATAGSAA
jgi:hypothetical protein